MVQLDGLDVAGKRVFVRVDFNVPLRDGSVQDDTRIRAALPTIQAIIDAGGMPVLASHLGRPKGQRVEELSLAPVAERLAAVGDLEVIFVENCVGEDVRAVIGTQRHGQVLLLENLRFHPGEKANDADFAQELTGFAERYVNDGTASVIGQQASSTQRLVCLSHVTERLACWSSVRSTTRSAA